MNDLGTMDFDEYSEFNKNISSKLFFSMMDILYDKLPCSSNFFRLKKLHL
jgi:hypothetical protein